MGFERATDSGPGDARDAQGSRGRLVPFPEPRAFGPLSWRTVRMASLTCLLLLLLGTLVDLFLGPCLRSDAAPAQRVSGARS